MVVCLGRCFIYMELHDKHAICLQNSINPAKIEHRHIFIVYLCYTVCVNRLGATHIPHILQCVALGNNIQTTAPITATTTTRKTDCMKQCDWRNKLYFQSTWIAVLRRFIHQKKTNWNIYSISIFHSDWVKLNRTPQKQKNNNNKRMKICYTIGASTILVYTYRCKDNNKFNWKLYVNFFVLSFAANK